MCSWLKLSVIWYWPAWVCSTLYWTGTRQHSKQHYSPPNYETFDSIMVSPQHARNKIIIHVGKNTSKSDPLHNVNPTPDDALLQPSNTVPSSLQHEDNIPSRENFALLTTNSINSRYDEPLEVEVNKSSNHDINNVTEENQIGNVQGWFRHLKCCIKTSFRRRRIFYLSNAYW